MGISEPSPAAAEVAPDLLFVPLAAFDRSGASDRLWRRLLRPHPRGACARAKKSTAVGVAYASQETERDSA